MKQQVLLSGVEGLTLSASIRKSIKETSPRIVGIASAFVSNQGVQILKDILRGCGDPKCRLIAGTDNAITHPEALYAARSFGWEVRLGSAPHGIFHPKLLVAGQKVSRAGLISQLACLYVGSSNLTSGGLSRNVECGLIAHAEDCPESASTAFAQLWGTARRATDGELRNYAARFAELARRRTVAELEDLGVSDSAVTHSGPKDLRGHKPPTRPALRTEFAIAAWAGLQSFTGDYRFQVEFPKAAGTVIAQLVRHQKQRGGRVEVYCPDDNTTRPMQYGFYSDNSMFRLNIPNDVPGVAWAREHKDGVAIVESGPHGGAPLRLRVLKPGADAREVVGRSVALGTWGRTLTRIYGWY